MTFSGSNFLSTLVGFAGRIFLASIAFCPAAMAQQAADWQACTSSDQFAAASKLAGCTRVLEQGVSSARLTAIALGNRALAYSWQNDPDRAITDFSEAIRLDPDFPNWRYARAMQYEKKAQYELALADLSDALRLRPGTAEYTDAIQRAQAALAAMPAAAAAPSATVEQIFKKYDLLGIFAQDCSKPPTVQTPPDGSRQNWWFVNRLIDAGHVQRDFMTSSTTRDFVIVIDKAVELQPNQIRVTGMRDGTLAVDMVWHIEPNLTRTWQGVGDTKGEVANGKYVKTGNDIPWLARCGGL